MPHTMKLKSTRSTLQHGLYILTICIWFIGCSSKESNITPLAAEYKVCCGQEPVEFSIPGKSVYVYVPNLFTPNGDGVNDSFFPIANAQIASLHHFIIYNPQSDPVDTFYQIYNISKDAMKDNGWDGLNKKNQLHKGNFAYTFIGSSVDGTNFTFQGSACSVLCGADAAQLLGKSKCYFPSQASTDGVLNASTAHGESTCFQ